MVVGGELFLCPLWEDIRMGVSGFVGQLRQMKPSCNG